MNNEIHEAFILQVCPDIKNMLEPDMWAQATDRRRGSGQKSSLLVRKYQPRTSIVTGVYVLVSFLWFPVDMLREPYIVGFALLCTDQNLSEKGEGH